MAVIVFAGGSGKTAKVPVTVTPTGLACTMEVWLATSSSSQTKVATSGAIAFTSTGVAQTINCPITMPTAAGTYWVNVDIISGGYLIGAFEDSNQIAIPSVVVGPITW